MLAGPNGDEMELKRLQVLDASRGMMNTIAVDMEGEDYDFKTFQMTGTKEILESTCNLLSAVTCIPQTILFGRSPAGENATGESDLENYYNFVEGIQKRMLKKNIRTLIKAIVQAGVYDGSIENPGNIKPTFKPLWSLSETEKATVELTKAQRAQVAAQTAQLYIDMQAIQPEEVRQALAQGGSLNIEDILDNQPEDEQEESADWEELFNSLANENHLQNPAGQDTLKSGIIKGKNADDRLDEFKESDHPRDKDGKFSESGSGGQSKAESQQKESTQEQPESKVSATGANVPCTGFASKAKLNDHTKRHGPEIGVSSEAEYQQRGIDFLKQGCGGDVVGYATSDGKVVRFNRKTTEYASGIPGGALKTYMRAKCKKDGSPDPERANEYYERIKERDGC